MGAQATLAGVGEVFEKFLETGILEGFTGCGQCPAKFDEEHFEDSPLRIMTFAESFYDMDYDCHESKIYYIPRDFQTDFFSCLG